MNYEILPYEGTTTLKLGMSSREIQEVIGCELKRKFKKFEDDKYDTERYEDFFVYYKDPGACEAFEFFHPAKVFFMQKDLLDIPFEEAKALFVALDNDIKYNGVGLISLKCGIAIYAPDAAENPEKKSEGVLVFEKGYYGELYK